MTEGHGGRERRRTRVTLTALIVGAVLAGTGALVSLGVSYASYSDDGTVPLIGVQVTNRIPHSTPPESSAPRSTTPAGPPATTGHHPTTTPARPSVSRPPVRESAPATVVTVPATPPVHTSAPPTDTPPAAATSASADSGQQ